MQLSVRDAAQLLNVSEKTVYRWAQKGEIPFFRVNDQYRFNRMELLEWATGRRIPVSPQIFAEPDQGPLPSVTAALEAGGIFYRIGGTDVPSVLRDVVDHLRVPEEVDREHLYQVLLARENLGSTGLGDGIAVPHVRSPIVLHVGRPTVTLCFLERPVDFKALDGVPVGVLFTLVSPTVRAHLHLLSRLAFCLRDPHLRRILAEPASREVVLQAFREAEADLLGARAGTGE
ncbi:MAG: PTS sugar transporter subunit IIA [Deferrisomatales bacterium]